LTHYHHYGLSLINHHPLKKANEMKLNMGISRQELQSTFSKQAVCTEMHYLCYVLFTKKLQ